jgi:hypothetical protein
VFLALKELGISQETVVTRDFFKTKVSDFKDDLSFKDKLKVTLATNSVSKSTDW